MNVHCQNEQSEMGIMGGMKKKTLHSHDSIEIRTYSWIEP